MNWKTIQKDGYPKPGYFVLCHIKHEFNSWSDYHVYFYGKQKNFPRNEFWLYDLMIEEKDIIEYVELDKK